MRVAHLQVIGEIGNPQFLVVRDGLLIPLISLHVVADGLVVALLLIEGLCDAVGILCLGHQDLLRVVVIADADQPVVESGKYIGEHRLLGAAHITLHRRVQPLIDSDKSLGIKGIDHIKTLFVLAEGVHHLLVIHPFRNLVT